MPHLLGAVVFLFLVAAAKQAVSQQPKPDEAPPAYPAILRTTFKGHTDKVSCVAAAADGKTIASGGVDKTVRLWDTATGLQTHLLQNASAITCVAFSADGKKLVAGDMATLVTLWDTNTGEKLRTLKGIAGPVLQVALTAEGKVAGAVGSKSGMIWDTETGETKMTFKGQRFAIALDGKTFAWSRSGGAIIFWDLATNNPLGSASGHRDGVQALAFSPDAKVLASAASTGGIGGSGMDKSIKLWNVGQGNELANLVGHSKGVYSLTFAPNGKSLVAADFNGSIKLWDLDQAKVKARLEKIKVGETLTGTPVGYWAFAPDLMTWVVGTDNEVLWLDIADFTKASR